MTYTKDGKVARVLQETRKHRHVLEIDDNTGKAKTILPLTTHPQDNKFTSILIATGTVEEPDSLTNQYGVTSHKVYELNKEDYNIDPKGKEYLEKKVKDFERIEETLQRKLGEGSLVFP